jgi:hypothetical protein
VGCIRIRSLNTSQSDEVIDRNKVTFPRMEEYIFCCCCFQIFLSKCWADGGVASLHVFSVYIQVLFMWHLWPTNIKLPFEFSQAKGVVLAKVSQVREKLIRAPTATHKQTASPDYHVPSGSMLRDNSVAWGTPLSQCRLPFRCFVPISFLMLSPFFCTDLAGRPSASAGSVIEVPLFCDSCTA